MENTTEDFWRMVWEHKCEIIVMAVNFQERGIVRQDYKPSFRHSDGLFVSKLLPKEKSCRYWPAQGSEEYGCMAVTLLQQTTHTDYTNSLLQVRLVGSQEARTVRHYRLTTWPLQGVPQTTKPILDFLR